MDYMLVDSNGNAIDAFSDRGAAEKALLMLVKEDHAAARDVALFAFDRRGVVVGEPVVAADLRPEYAVDVVFEDQRYHQVEGLTFSSWTAETVRAFLAPVPEVTNAVLVS